MKEIWKDIEGYEGLYQVSNLGRVKSLPKQKRFGEILLKQNTIKGYKRVCLSKNNVQKYYLVHRLVAHAFISNLENKEQINHKDENKKNNCVNNLEWCDRKYNLNYGTAKERMAQKLRKKVLQYDLNGNLLKEYKSITEATIMTNIPNSNISNCCNKTEHYKTAGGYIWEFK